MARGHGGAARARGAPGGRGLGIRGGAWRGRKGRALAAEPGLPTRGWPPSSLLGAGPPVPPFLSPSWSGTRDQMIPSGDLIGFSDKEG